MGTVLCTSVVLAGCSNGSSSSAAFSTSGSGASTSNTTASSSASNEDNTPITLSITWWGSQTRHDYTQKLLDMYHTLHPNVSFQATPAGWDGYETKLATEAAGSSLPDIIQTDYTFLTEFTENNSLADLSSFINDKTIDMTNVNPSLVSSGKVNGILGAVPVSEAALAVSYSPDVFQKAGLAEPTSSWTWNDFVNDALTIQQKTGLYGDGKTFVLDEGDIIFNYYLRQYNLALFSADGKSLGYTDDKYFVDFMTMLKKLQDAKAMPTIDQYTQIAAKGKEQALVTQNQAGFMWEWSNYPSIVQATNPNLKLVAMPNDGQSVQPMYLKPGMFFSVAQNSKYQKQAAEFINWFINDPEANKVINAERGVPVSSTIRAAMEPNLSATDKAMFDYIDQVSKTASQISPPNPSGSAEVTQDMYNEVSAFLYGKKTAEQAAADFRKEATSVLSNNS